MVGVTMILTALDCFLVYSTATQLLTHGPSMQLLFGFEYLVLLTAIVSTFCKYVLQCVDHNAEQQWDAKAIYMFYVDIVQVPHTPSTRTPWHMAHACQCEARHPNLLT
jgi:E3 ubiquitin-protein ligase synoviolin